MPKITTGTASSSEIRVNENSEIVTGNHTLSVKPSTAELTKKMEKTNLKEHIQNEQDPRISGVCTGRIKSKKIKSKTDIEQITGVISQLFLLKGKGGKQISTALKAGVVNIAKRLNLDTSKLEKTSPSKITSDDLDCILKKLVKKSTNKVNLRTVVGELLNKPSLSAKITGIRLQAHLLEYQNAHEEKYFHKNDKVMIKAIDAKKDNMDSDNLKNHQVKVGKLTAAMRFVADELLKELKEQQADWKDTNIEIIRNKCFEGFSEKVSKAIWKPVSYTTGKEEFGEIMNVLFFASFAGSSSTNFVNLKYDKELNAKQLELMGTGLATLNERNSSHKLPKGDLGGHMAIFSPLGTELINRTFQSQVIETIGYQATRPVSHVKADVSQITNLQQACETYLSNKRLIDLPGKKAILWSSNKGLLKTGNEQLYSKENLAGLATALKNKGYEHLIIVGDKAAKVEKGKMLGKDGVKLNIDHLGLGNKVNNTPNNIQNIQNRMGDEIRVHDLTEMWKDPVLNAIEGENYIKQIAVFKELQKEGVDLSFGNRSGGMDLVMLSTGIGGVVYDDDPNSHRYFNMTSIAPHMQQIAVNVGSDFAHKVNQERASDLETRMDSSIQASAAYSI
ncbi:hypothetical protein [uncultured Shewanella sp.]|uniref:hypothetical protein n=1 Tax=uncultured Shewanella sp. TaxID=173975 RepID=UPI00261344E7|nr:hypothetical protein [uncultured Shewanella sp.]